MTLVTHHWQSTLCLGLAALAALALRNASARARHGVWLPASSHVPAAGVYANDPGTFAVAFNCAPPSAVP